MAWTTPKTWTVGELLTAANMNIHVRDNLNSLGHLLASKTADESVASNATPQNDDHLFYTISANEVWLFTWYLIYDAATAADLRIGFSYPSGRMVASAMWRNTGVGQLMFVDSGAASTTCQLGIFDGEGTGIRELLPLQGLFTNGAGGGTMQFQWAQGTSNATATNVFTNSTMWGVKLA